jgi:thioredoxin-like negative regulator of GroEL
MAESSKFDVLNANTPLPADVLENASGYLSSVILAQLQAASPEGQLSIRDSIKATGIAAQRYKSALLAHLTDSLFAAGNYSHVEVLLQNDPGRESREAIVGLKIQLQDYTSAQALLNAYPTSRHCRC